jgi:flagellar basal-body rod protein FlgG
MNGAYHVGAIGLEAQQRALDTIANNISNINTPGFKRSSVRFSEILSGPADLAAVGADLGSQSFTTSGVRAETVFMIDEPGKIQNTGRAYDLAVDGAGFIELMGPGGDTLLWRGGGLKVGDDGLLATAGGIPLKAAITVPDDVTSLEIASDGVVRGKSGGGEAVELGQIMLVQVADAAALERAEGGLYRPVEGARVTDARPGEDGAGLFVQGAIEAGNVELTSEMVQMMLVQRAYAANAQIVQAADQLMSIANGLRR